jgi:hypothetical protein
MSEENKFSQKKNKLEVLKFNCQSCPRFFIS